MVSDINTSHVWAVIVAVSQVVFFLTYAYIHLARNVDAFWTKVSGIAAAVVGVALLIALLS